MSQRGVLDKRAFVDKVRRYYNSGDENCLEVSIEENPEKEPTRSEWIVMYIYHKTYPGIPVGQIYQMRWSLAD